MNEKLVIVPRVRTPLKKLVIIELFAVSCLLLWLATFSSPIFSVPAIIVVVIWYWQTFRRNIEYEYTYYDGDLRMARIMNKAKRKNLIKINLEDVVTIAPKGDRSIYKYEQDNSYKYKDLSSGDKSAKKYAIIFKGDKGMYRYEFEPDAEMLDAICIKYPRTVVR